MIPSPERQAWILANMPNAIVATVRRDGLPQVTPNWYLWTGEEFWISTSAGTAKTHNLRRDRDEPDVVPHWETISSASECVIISVRPERFLWHDR